MGAPVAGYRSTQKLRRIRVIGNELLVKLKQPRIALYVKQ